MNDAPGSAIADICLVLEGTYPFVRGGVSSWVHHLVTELSDFRFSILHVSPRPGHYAEPVFAVPSNVVAVQECHLVPATAASGRAVLPLRALRGLSAWLTDLDHSEPPPLAAVMPWLPWLRRNPDAVTGLLASEHVFGLLCRQYELFAPQESFLDWFWQWQFVHQPLLALLATPLPEAQAYHACCTGYAGMLAAVAAAERGVPMLLTEHGIYARERRIEIEAAAWIHDRPAADIAPAPEAPRLREMWHRHFAALSRIAYAHADPIVTLSEGNRRVQLAAGAPASKTRIVPNGVDPRRFAAAAANVAARGADAPFTVGFAGRVTPIKDLRTFLAAMRLLADEIPELRVEVMGPMDEDPRYASDCRAFADDLGLGDRVAFRGQVDLTEALGDIDVLVLTSISEAQPLVILEAGAAGLPVVATDAGDCRELLVGAAATWPAPGPGGIVIPIADPGACARALLELYYDPPRRRQLGRDLQARVRVRHDQRAMVAAYRRLYSATRRRVEV